MDGTVRKGTNRRDTMNVQRYAITDAADLSGAPLAVGGIGYEVDDKPTVEDHQEVVSHLRRGAIEVAGARQPLIIWELQPQDPATVTVPVEA